MWTPAATLQQLREPSNWAAVLLAIGLLVDVSHVSGSLHRASVPSVPQRPRPIFQIRVCAAQKVVAAHLFGRSPAAGQVGLSSSPSTWVLSGVFARSDPQNGMAILAPRGKASHLYRTGDALDGAPDTHLLQVFPDRVVLSDDAGREIVSLLRLGDGKAGAQAVAMTAASTQAGPLNAEASANDGPTFAQSWFGALHPDVHRASDEGIEIHPERAYQRDYGLQAGDTVTDINGIAIRDAASLDAALRSATGAVTVTFTHQGSPLTVQVPVTQ